MAHRQAAPLIGRLHEDYLTGFLGRALASGRHGTFVSEADVIAASRRPDKPRSMRTSMRCRGDWVPMSACPASSRMGGYRCVLVAKPM
jgi:hypothetical protein